MKYDPRKYWIRRHAERGDGYVGTVGITFDTQAHKFLLALERLKIEFAPGSDVLDYGCGVGRLAGYWLSRNGVRSYTGADVVQGALYSARRRAPRGDFIWIDNEGKIPVEDGSFNIVFACTVFHHLPDDEMCVVAAELDRVSSYDARYVIIDTNIPRSAAIHMFPRGADRLCEILNVDKVQSHTVNVEFPDSHLVMEATKYVA